MKDDRDRLLDILEAIDRIERPTIIRQILDHLGLLSAAGLRSPPDDRASSEGLAAGGQPREWRYEPHFDDLPIPDPLAV